SLGGHQDGTPRRCDQDHRDRSTLLLRRYRYSFTSVEVRMWCSNCAVEVAEQKKFCGQCGSAVVRRCLACDAANPASSKFCGDCDEIARGCVCGGSDGEGLAPD